MNKLKILFCLFLLTLSLIHLNNTFKNINMLELLLSENKKELGIKVITNNKLNIKENKTQTKNIKQITNQTLLQQKTTKKPIIYIYNTHDKEEYKNNFYNITPTVKTVSNILKEELQNQNINSVIETRSPTKEVNRKRLDYQETYTISLKYLKENKQKYKTLKYFFDIHRDSVTGPSSKITINNKKYATMMFLVGTKNQKYKQNLKNIKIMEKYLNKNYKGLLRETYYQPNSTFYQDYNNKMFLVEIGGPENTLEEIYNTTVALSKAINYYMEVKNEK